MRRWAFIFVAVAVAWSAQRVPAASGQTMAYPDEAGYEQFRTSENDTLEALHNNPSRALAFRLLVCQRRLRETQLMVSKEKLNLVPGLLKDYQETIEGIKAFLQTLVLSPTESSQYFQTVEAARQRHQDILKHLGRMVPADLQPSIEAAFASSQQLRLLTYGTPSGEAAYPQAGTTGGARAKVQRPLSPEGTSTEETQAEQPLFPEGSTQSDFEVPEETDRPMTPDEVLGRRLRPGEPHTRGTRRPEDTHPRPRAR